MKYTKIPANTFSQLQLNAGLLLSDFTPGTPESGTSLLNNIIGATSGGVNFSAVPSYKDFGEGIDNCPLNTKELKKLDAWEVKLSGSFVSVDNAAVKRLLAAADIGTTDTSKVTPRIDLNDGDFDDLWWVGDYSDKNGESNGGFIAIHMMNALSTSGFSIQSSDKDKGSFSFEFTAHFSASAQTTVPFEIYVKAGTSEPTSGGGGGDAGGAGGDGNIT